MPYATPFVTEVAPDAKSLIYSTYLDYAYIVTGIAVLSNGNVIVTGDSPSSSYPTTKDAYQQNSGENGAFLTELNSTGSGLAYSTVIGDYSYNINGFALDPGNGDIWLAGRTSTPQFPLVNPIQSAFPPPQLGPSEPVSVLSQFDPTGQTLQFSTFLGGAADGYASSVAIDSNHRAHVAGAAGYGMYTTPGVYSGSVPEPGIGDSATFAYVALVDSTVPAPALCFIPAGYAELSFGASPLGTTSSSTIQISNCGNAPLNFISIGSSDPAFTVPAQYNTCTSPLAPKSTCMLNVAFTPTVAQEYSAQLTFTSNASLPATSVLLSGNGAVPMASFLQSNLNFFPALIGQTQPTMLALLINSGQVPLTISLAQTTVTGDFALVGPPGCGTIIYPSASCTFFISFTPTAAGNRTGLLTVPTNDPAHPTVSLSLSGTGYASYPLPTLTSLPNPTFPLNGGSTPIGVIGTNFFPASVVMVNGKPQVTAYLNPIELSFVLDPSLVDALGELQVSVMNPAPGGGQSATAMLTLYRTLTIQSDFLASVPGDPLLYAAIPDTATSNPNTVIPVNPATGAAGTPISVGKGPQLLAASDDGKYLYVALSIDQTVQRINLQTQAVERTFPFSPNPFCQGCSTLPATDMHVVPGNSQEVVLAQGDMISLYNDAGLVNYVPTGFVDYFPPGFSSFAFAGNPLTIYALPFTLVQNSFFTVVDISDAGLSWSPISGSNYGGNNSTGAGVISDGTLLYTSGGQVWNPSTQDQVGTFQSNNGGYAPAFTMDVGLGQIYQGQGTIISAYGKQSLQLTGTLALPQLPIAEITNLVRWGTNGLAFLSPDPSLAYQDIYTTASSVVAAQPGGSQITAISPNYGAIAASINLTGNFSASQGDGYVQVNGAKSQIISWSNSTIIVRVPYNGAPGLGSVVVTADGQKSNAVPFTLYAFPTITNVSVSSGMPGTPLTITGTNLLDGGGNASVSFNGTPAAITSDTATSIQVTVPTGATSGQLRVVVNGVSLEGLANFVALPSLPTITGISPNYGAIAASVNLTGNFGATEGDGYVQVNGAKSQIISWSNSAITIRVPYNGALGLGSVIATANGVRSNAVPFTLYAFPTITNVSVATGTPGTPVTITGTNLLDGGGKASVTFNGVPATNSGGSSTSIQVSVPRGATSGQLRVTVNGVSLEAVANFVIEPSLPNITGISSNFGAIGASIYLTGDFGARDGTGYVQVNGAKAQIVLWSNNAIMVRVPYNGALGLGSVVVTADGVRSNAVPFTIPRYY